MNKGNTLSIKLVSVEGVLFPKREHVGGERLFSFGKYGSAMGKIIEVAGDYVTYEFPEHFDLTAIKEQIYNEQSKKTFSIQSV